MVQRQLRSQLLLNYSGPSYIKMRIRMKCQMAPLVRNTDHWPRFNTLRPRQNGCHFPDDIFKCIFLNENAWISIKISLKFVPKCPINKIPALVQIMAWRRSGDKPISEPMMVSLLTHICVTQPQWVNKALNHTIYWLCLSISLCFQKPKWSEHISSIKSTIYIACLDT